VSKNTGSLIYINERYIPQDFVGHLVPVKNIRVGEFVFGKEWYPTSEPMPAFGIWPLITGTLLVTLGAILFALPLGLPRLYSWQK
jgi:phosphate transport system permease protein